MRIQLADGTKLSGSILRLEAETFTVVLEKTRQERTVPYNQVTEVKKKGLSRRAKAILIPAAIGGAVLLVLCVAPTRLATCAVRTRPKRARPEGPS